MVIATVGVSVPSFVLCVLSMYLFCDKLKLLPTYGLDSWNCYILPVGCMAFGQIAYITRLMRSSMLETMRQDFIRTERSKGIPDAGGDRKICTEELHSSGCYLCGSNGSGADDGYLYY